MTERFSRSQPPKAGPRVRGWIRHLLLAFRQQKEIPLTHIESTSGKARFGIPLKPRTTKFPRGASVYTINSANSAAQPGVRLTMLMLLTPLFAGIIAATNRSPMPGGKGAPGAKFTDREQQTLDLIAQGHSVAKIQEMWGLAHPQTVYHYINQAASKVGYQGNATQPGGARALLQEAAQKGLNAW